MSRLTPFPIAGGSYKDDTLPWSAQDTVNWLPVAAEKPGTTSAMLLRGVPGLQTVVASGQSAGLPVRGGYDADGFCAVVIGQSLYRFDGQATTLLGTIPGIQRVQFAHNQVAGGVQIAIATGTGGYVYDTAAQALAQITDDGFPGAKSFAYMDSYIIGVDPTGNFWFNSDLANATSYNTLNRYEAESEPDRIQTLLVSHEDVVIFGARTTEFWYDSGANIGTFQRRDGTGFEIGCVSAYAAVNLDNTVYWRGHDGSAYRLNGYIAQRISTGPIEQDWAKSDPSQCFAMTFVDDGHKIVYWTQPDGKTWGYDVATGEWHRRTSHLMDRWRANCLFRHKRTWYAGDYTNGRLYALGWKVNTEDGQPLVAERTTTVMQDDRNRFRFNAVEVVMDAQESAPPESAPPFTITGNLPDASTFVTADFRYTLKGGATPYGSVVVESGTFPPGLSLDATGHATGEYTTPGTYTWTVKGVDGAGATARVTDSCVVHGVIALLDFNTSLTNDPTGTIWSVESGNITDRWGAQPVTVPYLVTTPAKEGSAMLKTPDTANHDGTYDYAGSDNTGVTAQLGTKAIGASVDFCMEMYVRLNVHFPYLASGNYAFASFLTNNGVWRLPAFIDTNTSVLMSDVSVPTGVTRTLWKPPNLAPTAGTFFHHAVCRKGDVVSLYYNGAKYAEYTGAAALSIRSTDTIYIGNGNGGSGSALGWPGQFDDVRITSGWSRYDGNFTPPVVPYQS